MSVRDRAIGRKIEAEIERGLSPLDVGFRWDYGDLWVKVEGYDEYRIARSFVSWDSAIQRIITWRGDLRRKGIQLDPWEPPLPPTQS